MRSNHPFSYRGDSTVFPSRPSDGLEESLESNGAEELGWSGIVVSTWPKKWQKVTGFRVKPGNSRGNWVIEKNGG